MDEAVRDAVAEVEAGLLDQTPAKLKAQRLPKDLLGFIHTKDCAENLDRLRAVRHQVGNINTLRFENIAQRVFNLRSEQMRRDNKVAVEARVQSAKEDALVAGRNERIVADDEQQVLVRGLVVIEYLDACRLYESIDPQRPMKLGCLRERLVF